MAEPVKSSLPTGREDRKAVPLARGLLDYFPAALAAVAIVSKAGNDQHNQGEEMHHARGKSTDHADCILRHLVDRGTLDTDGQPHSAKVAWRALAMLQEELEAQGAPLPRGARLPEDPSRVQAVGTGQALSELEATVRWRTYEEIARRLIEIGEPWIAEQVRQWRWER